MHSHLLTLGDALVNCHCILVEEELRNQTIRHFPMEEGPIPKGFDLGKHPDWYQGKQFSKGTAKARAGRAWWPQSCWVALQMGSPLPTSEKPQTQPLSARNAVAPHRNCAGPSKITA